MDDWSKNIVSEQGVGRRLKVLLPIRLKERNLKIKDYADLIGVTPATFSNIFKEKTLPAGKITKSLYWILTPEEIAWVFTGKEYKSDVNLELEKERARNKALERKLREVKKLWRSRKESLLNQPVQMEFSLPVG